MRKHVLICVGCDVMTDCVEILKWCVSLRRMLVCCRELYVCQGFPVVWTKDREHFIEAFMLFVERVDGTLLIWFMNSRDVIPSVTSDWWTIYVCEFSVTRWTPSSRHFCCLRSEMLLFQLLLMEHSSSSVHHLSHLQPCQRTLIISSFVPPKTSTSRLQLKICIVFESTSRNCITLWTITVTHL